MKALVIGAGVLLLAAPAVAQVRFGPTEALNYADMNPSMNVCQIADGTTDLWFYPQAGRAPDETVRPVRSAMRRTSNVYLYAPSANVAVHFYGGANMDTVTVTLYAGIGLSLPAQCDSIRIDRTNTTPVQILAPTVPKEGQ